MIRKLRDPDAEDVSPFDNRPDYSVDDEEASMIRNALKPNAPQGDTKDDEPFNYAEWVKGDFSPQPYNEFQTFACDWVKPGMTHDEGVQACIEGILGHCPTDGADAIRTAVLTWGYLGSEEEVPELDHHDKPTCTDCGAVQGTGHMGWCPRRGDARNDYQGPSLNEIEARRGARRAPWPFKSTPIL